MLVVALAAVVPILMGAPRAAAAQASCTGNAMVFDARDNGQLWLYVNTAPAAGTASWSTVKQIGSGFSGLVKAGPNGDVYFITSAGQLRLYHFTGTGWTNPAGLTIGSGWQYYLSHTDQITIDSSGRIFVVDTNDTLREYHYNQQANSWDNAAGDILDQSWSVRGSILPALIASERAMPNNYIASLRLAQMQIAAKHYDEAEAACDRGLAREPGANGRAWLLQIKAKVFIQRGRKAEARRLLEDALHVAQEIPDPMGRDMSMGMISNALKAAEETPK